MIAVVGGGLIGACVAFELAQAGHEVLVLDADLPGAAWRAGAGLLTPSGERLRGTPLEGDASESLGLWPDFARRLEEVSGQHIGFQEGVFRVAFDEEQARTLNADTDGEARDFSHSHLSAARFHANEGRVHPPSVRGAALSGLRVLHARVERIEPLEKGLGLHLDSGVFVDAHVAVLCCGAWSGAFGLPICAVQGQALLLDAPRDSPALYGPSQNGSSQYALGRLDGLYVGATSRDASTEETSPDAASVEILRDKARRLMGEETANAPIVKHLVGFRPTTPDGLPIIGLHPELANVVVATGHSRHGVLLAPLTARRVSQLVRELLGKYGQSAEDAAQVAVARGAAQVMVPEAAALIVVPSATQAVTSGEAPVAAPSATQVVVTKDTAQVAPNATHAVVEDTKQVAVAPDGAQVAVGRPRLRSGQHVQQGTLAIEVNA